MKYSRLSVDLFGFVEDKLICEWQRDGCDDVPPCVLYSRADLTLDEKK